MSITTKLYLLLLLPVLSIYGQQTIKGQILDDNKVPLAFANIYYHNTKIGTTADIDGYFEIERHNTHYVLEISFMGFQTKKINISNQKSPLKIILHEGQILNEVILVSRPKKRLKKKENPAYPILRKIWAKKHSNGLEKSAHYRYKKYSSVESGLSNLDSTFVKTIFRSKYDSIISTMRKNNSSLSSNSLKIPFKISEKIESIYGAYGNSKSIIEAEKENGVKMTGYLFETSKQIFKNIDVYKNNFQIFNSFFVSPISKAGFASYDYVLQDSLKIDNKIKSYAIYFFPRRDSDLTFKGFFKVDVPSYSLTKIQMKANKNINVNLINNLFIDKKYRIINDSVFVETENIYETGYSLFTKSDEEKSLYTVKKEVFEDYQFSEHSLFDIDTLSTPKDPTVRSKQYWDKSNLDDINDSSREYLGKVMQSKKVKRTTNIINVLTTGYFIPFKNVRIGQLYNMLNYNTVEGLRLHINIESFKTINDRFRISTFEAYGFNDQQIKYGIDFRYLFNKNPRLFSIMTYSNDLEEASSGLLERRDWLGHHKPFKERLGFNFKPSYLLTQIQQFITGIDAELFESFHLGASIKYRNFESSQKSSSFFNISYLDDNSKVQHGYQSVETSAYILYQPGRIMFGKGISRRVAKNLFPTLMFKYTQAIPVGGNNFNYNKVQLAYSHPFSLGFLGNTTPALQLGKTFGKTPIMLLSAIPATLGFSTSNQVFSLINNYDFVTDTYAALFVDHNFNGFFFNRIPLVKKLRLKSVIFVKGVYGTISDKNIAISRSNIPYNTPSKNIYYEYGVGIKNIGFGNVRFIRVNFNWRGNIPNDFKKAVIPNVDNSAPHQWFTYSIGLFPNF